MDTDTVDAWVLHSAYPDGTWRGIEKCATAWNADGPLLFYSEDAARDFLERDENAHMREFFRIVHCTITTPCIRKRLDAVPLEYPDETAQQADRVPCIRLRVRHEPSPSGRMPGALNDFSFAAWQGWLVLASKDEHVLEIQTEREESAKDAETRFVTAANESAHDTLVRALAEGSNAV